MINNKFPKEVGPPRQVVRSMKEFLDYVNLYNGKKKAIYQSIYNFGGMKERNKPNYETAEIDKVFFDFDDKRCNAWLECNKLHNECLKNNYKHFIVMSGRGYHLYIFTTPLFIKHKKETLRGCQEYFIKKLNLKVDEQIIGNIAQLARIPNTYHPKAGRFCIPLNKQQFDLGDESIKKLAENQNFIKDYLIGCKLFDISRWDMKRKDEFEEITPIITPQDSSGNTPTIKELPLCISKLLTNKNLGWKGRYLVILYFKEQGYIMKEVYDILKQHLSEVKLHHCIQQEKQLQYLFERNDLMFPKCERIKEDGVCVGKCKFFNKTIYV